MKILVAYYSRHGHTRKVGKRIADLLGAESEEIIDKKDRKHLATWFYSAFDEELRSPTKIEQIKNDPKDFDLVVIGTPIWDGVTPAVKRFLSEHDFGKVAFFITFGASAENAAFIMGKMIKQKPSAVLELQDREIDMGAEKKIRYFCDMIKGIL